jgi:ubiquinone/menaquinone biosynthesis C-methylase UbiE
MPNEALSAFLDTQRIVSSLGVVQGQHVADFGCGSGFFTVAFARAVGPTGRVTALDVMQEPLDAVAARAEAEGLANIVPVRANLEVPGNTKLADQSQDLVLLANVLFQSSQREAILQEAVRVLRPGGRIVVIDWRQGADQVGPPDHMRVSMAKVASTLEGLGVTMDRPLDVGASYEAHIFTR